MKRLGFGFLFLTLSFLFDSIYSQSIQLGSVNVDKNSALNKIFFDYKLVKIEYDQLKSAMSSRGNEHFLHLQGADLDWSLDMFANDIHSGNYILLLGTDHGVETLHRKPANTPMIGYLKSARGGQARLVVADQFMAGMVEQGGITFYIEPANYMDPSLPADYLVIYNTDNVIQNSKISCGYELYKNQLKNVEQQSKEVQNIQRSGCKTVEIAIANDFTVFQKKGSQSAVENWNTTLLTLMNTNYDNEFSTSLEFVQTASFVAVSQAGDPWNGINDISSELDKHHTWGNGGGYGGASYDVATCWTAKWTSGAVGLAWLGVVCTSLRYNVCDDYGGSNSCLKQLEAHETGHNFNADHDASGSPYIMAPAVNCSNDWSSASVAAINQHIDTRSCLDVCSSGGVAPIADFFGTPQDKCIPFAVQFTDLSTNDPTTWLWTFNGGVPSSSTLQKPPLIQYAVYGSYDVTLKVTNNYGSNTVTFKNYILANDKPVAKFTKVISGRDVYFTNGTLNGISYEWDFGDSETSNDVDPTHTYANDGVYIVVLHATNDCGTVSTKQTITIVTNPIALFVADTTKGCASFKVKYTNLSSKNVITWAWEFPGGTPSTSALFEPTIEYKNHGVFDVKLTAKNSKYQATAEKLKYITVDSIPLAVFDTLVNKNVVNFTNKTSNAQTWQWDFGDGTTSTDFNPSHTYGPGTYLAKLTATNLCGSNTITKQIVITSSLSINFKVDQPKGCAPFVVQFTNVSIGSIFYLWSFPGGSPSSSTDLNPIVTYNNPGTFDAQLMGGNAKDTIVVLSPLKIEIQATPKADFTILVGGSTVYFTNQSKYGSSYYWDFGDGSFSIEKAPFHTYTAEGEYIVKMLTANNCGSDTIIKNVAVFLIPKIDFGADTTKVCGSGNVQFKSKTSSDVNFWSWHFDGGKPDISDEKNPLVYYDKKGIYSVKLTVKNSNGENELVKQSYIKVISTVLCPEWVYYKNADLNEVITDPLRRYQSENTSVYPNPFNGILNIRGNSESDQIQLRIFNLVGAEVYQEIIAVANGHYHREINFDSFKEGTYYINLSSAKDNITKTVFLSR